MEILRILKEEKINTESKYSHVNNKVPHNTSQHWTWFRFFN